MSRSVRGSTYRAVIGGLSRPPPGIGAAEAGVTALGTGTDAAFGQSGWRNYHRAAGIVFSLTPVPIRLAARRVGAT